jgi:hypothetical protein
LTGNDFISQTFAPVSVSDITAVSFWAIRSDGPYDTYVFSYSDGTSQLFTADGTGDTGWTFFDVTSNLTAGKSLIGFEIFGTTPGTAFLDDLSITTASAVPGPTMGAGPASFAFAALVLGWLVRRRAHQTV